MLKPYYIKANAQHVRVVLAYQYFSVLINQDVYQFIPIEAKEIRLNRNSKKVENISARFAFQKGKKIVYMSMTELISLPDFIDQLHTIAEPYFSVDAEVLNEKQDQLIYEFEMVILYIFIDDALDQRDFHKLDNLFEL